MSPRGARATEFSGGQYTAAEIDPALRYQHWAADNPPGASGTLANRIELLAGFPF
jgi:hypothetical protein